jgi:hypothetical protein
MNTTTDIRKEEAATPIFDLVENALTRMSRGARMLLDSIPGDSSLSLSVHSGDVSKAIADEITALRAKVKAQADELKRQAQAWNNVVELDLIPQQHKYSAEVLRRAAQEASDE